MRILGIIPAKALSTRVPDKNMRKVNGQTLVSRAMYSAYPCDAVAVCSESTNLLTYAGVFESGHLQNYPHLHLITLPTELTQPMCQLEPVIQFAMDYVGIHQFDAFVILQPSSPLREQRDVKGAIGILTKSGCDTVVSVSPSTHHYHFSGTVHKPADGIGMVFKPIRDISTRVLSQNLPTMVAENGAVYAFTKKHWLATGSRMGGDMRAMIMDEPHGLDVDYEKDLKLADIFLKGMKS